jgi:hypothetical protein
MHGIDSFVVAIGRIAKNEGVQIENLTGTRTFLDIRLVRCRAPTQPKTAKNLAAAPSLNTFGFRGDHAYSQLPGGTHVRDHVGIIVTDEYGRDRLSHNWHNDTLCLG